MKPGTNGTIILDHIAEVETAQIVLYKARKYGVEPDKRRDASAPLGEYDYPNVPAELTFGQAAGILTAAKWARKNDLTGGSTLDLSEQHETELIAMLEAHLPPEFQDVESSATNNPSA